MRYVFLILFVLYMFFHIACGWTAIPAESPDDGNVWVRTVDGWEKSSSWRIRSPLPAALHPLIFATFELLAALLALIGLSADKNQSYTLDQVPTHAPNQPAHLEHTYRR